MRTKKIYPQVIKRIYRPEITECVECQSRLRRAATVSQRMVVTLSEVVRILHCAYRCPNRQCPGQARLYRGTQADALALPGFTFGLDVVLLVGQLRLSAHQTVDEIHQILTDRLTLIQQTISRREMLFLFEAYSALLRAGTEVSQDVEWKKQARQNGGVLLSIDGIQPDNGNETMYLVRDVWTGRLLKADNVTESTKERVLQVLAPVVALDVPVVGVISDATEDERLRLGHLWKVLSHLRPSLVQCYDRADFPRTNNDMERTIRAIKMHYRRDPRAQKLEQVFPSLWQMCLVSRMVASATQWSRSVV